MKKSRSNSNEAIVKRILSSRKYMHLYPQTVERTVQKTSERYPQKDVEQKARQKLHQMWGAFVMNTNYSRVLKQFRNDVQEGKDDRQILWTIMKSHTSTKERLPDLDIFYNDLFRITGKPTSIVEHGCGLNPLSYPWIGEGVKYTGFDIDTQLIDLCTEVMKVLGHSSNLSLFPGDILIDTLPPADIYLLLKLIPLLKHQESLDVNSFLRKIPAKYVVVSFPNQSITGKGKNMKDFYQQEFHEAIDEDDWNISRLDFQMETVYTAHLKN